MKSIDSGLCLSRCCRTAGRVIAGARMGEEEDEGEGAGVAWEKRDKE